MFALGLKWANYCIFNIVIISNTLCTILLFVKAFTSLGRDYWVVCVLRINEGAVSGQADNIFISIFLVIESESKRLSNPNDCKMSAPPSKSTKSVVVPVLNIYNRRAWSLMCRLHVRSNEQKKAVKCPHDPLPSVWEGEANSSCSSPPKLQASSKVSCQTGAVGRGVGGAVIQPNTRLESRTKKKHINELLKHSCIFGRNLKQRFKRNQVCFLQNQNPQSGNNSNRKHIWPIGSVHCSRLK